MHLEGCQSLTVWTGWFFLDQIFSFSTEGGADTASFKVTLVNYKILKFDMTKCQHLHLLTACTQKSAHVAKILGKINKFLKLTKSDSMSHKYLITVLNGIEVCHV